MGSRVSTATIAGLACASAVLAAPLVIHDRYLLRVLTFAGINVIIVIGLSLLFGYAGQISLGHAAFFGLGAYTCGVLTTTYAWPWLGAVIVAVVAAAAAGAALALPALRLRGHYLAMATLGVGEIAVVVFSELKSVTGGIDGLSGIPFPSAGAIKIQTPAGNYILVWAVVVVAYALVRNLVALRPGRALRAVHGSEAGANSCGIDVSRVKVQAFTISAALAGLAGALYGGVVGFISPSSFALGFSILLLAMVALGGSGSLIGPVLAAVGLTLLPYADALMPGLPKSAVGFLADWNNDIYGLVLILVMIFMPGGLAGAFGRLAERVAARRQERSS